MTGWSPCGAVTACRGIRPGRATGAGKLAGEDPGDRDDADDQHESGDHREAGGATIHQPLAMIPTTPLTSKKAPMPPTAIHTAMRAGEICGFSRRAESSFTLEP